MAVSEAPLQRTLGVWTTTITGVGTILGAGIYVLIGEAAGHAGSAVWVAFVIAAVLAAGTGLAYAELASMFPEAGAASTYARMAFGRTIGFVTGWLRLIVGVIGAAAVALGFGGYLASLTGWPKEPLALGVIIAAAAVVYIGIRETVAVAIALTFLEVGGLVLIVVTGAPHLGVHNLLDAPQGVAGVLAAAALVFFAYEGFEEMASLSEETRNPTRTIPRAMLLAIAISTLCYIAVSVVAVSVLPWRELAASSSPLADVARHAVSGRLASALSLIALCSTGNTVLVLIAGSARVAYGMAGRRLLPSPFRLVSGARHTPWFATCVIAAAAFAFALAGDIGLVAQVTNFAVFGAFIAVNGAVIRLRFTAPAAVRPFRNGLPIARVPLAPAIGLVSTLVLITRLDGRALLAGGAATLLGFALAPLALRHEVSPVPDADAERAAP